MVYAVITNLCSLCSLPTGETRGQVITWSVQQVVIPPRDPSSNPTKPAKMESNSQRKVQV